MSPDGKKKKKERKKRVEESVRSVSVSDNCLEQQTRVGLKVPAKAKRSVIFQGYDIRHCTCTHR